MIKINKLNLMFLFFAILYPQKTQSIKKEALKPQKTIVIPSDIKIELSGEIELELINIEGTDNNSYDQYLKKIDNRSPYAQIDKAVLDLKILYSKNTSYRINLRFNDDKAYVDKNYLLFKKSNLKFEIGKNKPKIALKRKSEVYPLIGTAFWRGREYHTDLEYKLNNIDLKLGSTIALKRPLGYDYIAEDKSFDKNHILVYDDYKPISGQTIEYGLRTNYTYGGLNICSWYYTGKLINDYDRVKILHSDFKLYKTLENEEISSFDSNLDHYWFGGRVSVSVFDFECIGEYISSVDGFLKRDGFYVELKKEFILPITPNRKSIFLLRTGGLKIDKNRENFYPLLNDVFTWDRSLKTIALAHKLNKDINIKLEYYILNESTGDTKELALNENRRYQPNINDNHFLMQLELSF